MGMGNAERVGGRYESCWLTVHRGQCPWEETGNGCSGLVLTQSSSYIPDMWRGPVPVPVSNVGPGKAGRERLL